MIIIRTSIFCSLPFCCIQAKITPPQPQLYKTDDNGKREYLSKADAARTIAETRAKKDDLCN